VRHAWLPTVGIVLLLCGCSPSPNVADDPTPAVSPVIPVPTDGVRVVDLRTLGVTPAIDLLPLLPIKAALPITGYARTADFGVAWIDVDGNGCDTRNDLLARDLTSITRSGPCKVTTGTLISPYSGVAVHFVRGEQTSGLVQIDHVVALGNAWKTGAQSLSRSERITLANDPLELFAIDGATNVDKGDQDAASWMPPKISFDCRYVARQISVKLTYSLWVTPPEHDAMARVLAGCPDVTGTTSTFTS